MLRPIPNLADLLADASRISDVPAEAIPGLLGDIERLRAGLWARLTIPTATTNGPAADGDRLLTVEEAAQKLGMSKDWIYSHINADLKPAVSRIGSGERKAVRFSAAGLDRYIKIRTGR
jgi:predicted DNA-binding transcriptional regulator AlpA